MNRYWIIWLVLAAMATVAVAPAPLWAQGCPWCTTPTKCEGIEENTPLERCFVQQGEGCMEESGECIYEAWLTPSTREAFLASNGIAYQGTQTVDVDGIEVEAFLIDDVFVALWKCDGQVSLLWRAQEDGTWQDVKLARLRNRFALKPIVLAVPMHR